MDGNRRHRRGVGVGGGAGGGEELSFPHHSFSKFIKIHDDLRVYFQARNVNGIL